MDTYQERYIAHQKRKAEVLREILEERHSTRMFSEQEVDVEHLEQIVQDCIKFTASSCDRKPYFIRMHDGRDAKALLGGLLVGGVGWVHRAKVIILVAMDKIAYKAGDEINYMPYLDGGFLSCNLINTLSANDYKCCFVNPNIREENKEFFSSKFIDMDKYIYIGAIALGYEKK